MDIKRSKMLGLFQKGPLTFVTKCTQKRLPNKQLHFGDLKVYIRNKPLKNSKYRKTPFVIES
jgi:hypothetical protein